MPSKDVYVQLAAKFNTPIKLIILGNEGSIKKDVENLSSEKTALKASNQIPLKKMVGIDFELFKVFNWQLHIYDYITPRLPRLDVLREMQLKRTEIALVCPVTDADVVSYKTEIKNASPNAVIIFIVKSDQQFTNLNTDSDKVVVFDGTLSKEKFYAKIMAEFLKEQQIDAAPVIQHRPS